MPIETPPEAAPPVVRSGHRRHERRQFLEDNFLATTSTFVAGLLGFLLQSIASHNLHPAAYGKAFAVYSFFFLLTRPAAALGRLQAWQTSRELHTDGAGEVSGALLTQQTVWLLSIGGVIALAFSLGGSVLGSYLHVSVQDVAIAAISVPFLLAVQPLLGSLQGEQLFVPWSVLSILVNFSRLVFIVALIVPLGAFGFLLGNTLAAIVTFAVCLAVVWRNIRARRGRFSWSPALPFIITGLVSTITIGVYQGADIVLVEHFFSKVPAGQYAAVASLGSAVFFASGGVASAVFPMVAVRQAQGRSTVPIMAASFCLCAFTGLVGFLVLQLYGRTILIDFAGRKYLPGTHYLSWYAVGMAVLAWVSVLVNTQQSLNNLSLLWVLIPATILRPLVLILFHETLLTVVLVTDLLITAVALIMTVMYMVYEHARLSSGRAELTDVGTGLSERVEDGGGWAAAGSAGLAETGTP